MKTLSLRNMGLTAVVAAVAMSVAGCDSMLWDTSLGVNSNGGVGVSIGANGPYGSGSIGVPIYSPIYNGPFWGSGYYPAPVYNPGPVIRPPRPHHAWYPNLRPANGIGYRPAVLPGSNTRPGIINTGGEPGPVIPNGAVVSPGQYRPGGNVPVRK